MNYRLVFFLYFCISVVIADWKVNFYIKDATISISTIQENVAKFADVNKEDVVVSDNKQIIDVWFTDRNDAYAFQPKITPNFTSIGLTGATLVSVSPPDEANRNTNPGISSDMMSVIIAVSVIGGVLVLIVAWYYYYKVYLPGRNNPMYYQQPGMQPGMQPGAMQPGAMQPGAMGRLFENVPLIPRGYTRV